MTGHQQTGSVLGRGGAPTGRARIAGGGRGEVFLRGRPEEVHAVGREQLEEWRREAEERQGEDREVAPAPGSEDGDDTAVSQ